MLPKEVASPSVVGNKVAFAPTVCCRRVLQSVENSSVMTNSEYKNTAQLRIERTFDCSEGEEGIYSIHSIGSPLIGIESRFNKGDERKGGEGKVRGR